MLFVWDGSDTPPLIIETKWVSFSFPTFLLLSELNFYCRFFSFSPVLVALSDLFVWGLCAFLLVHIIKLLIEESYPLDLINRDACFLSIFTYKFVSASWYNNFYFPIEQTILTHVILIWFTMRSTIFFYKVFRS